MLQPLWILGPDFGSGSDPLRLFEQRRDCRKSDVPGGGGRGGGRRGGGDVPVTVAKASLRDVPVEIQVIGNVEAYSTSRSKPWWAVS